MYANLRFLNNVAETDGKLLDFLLEANNEVGSLTVEGVAKLEQHTARALYLEDETLLLPTDSSGQPALDCAL